MASPQQLRPASGVLRQISKEKHPPLTRSTRIDPFSRNEYSTPTFNRSNRFLEEYREHYPSPTRYENNLFPMTNVFKMYVQRRGKLIESSDGTKVSILNVTGREIVNRFALSKSVFEMQAIGPGSYNIKGIFDQKPIPVRPLSAPPEIKRGISAVLELTNALNYQPRRTTQEK